MTMMTIIMDNGDNWNGQWWQLKWTMMTIIMDNGGNYDGKSRQL